MDKETTSPNPPLTTEDLAGELSSRVMTIQPLINLKEEPVATDVEEEPEATVGLTIV